MSTEPTNSSERFEPRATSAMGEMFDHVSPRYALLNRLMSLGQDRAWRRAMWAAVPERARVVLDLCTGDGSSLPGLRRPGRLVIGIDASFGMLEVAQETSRGTGWAPRLVCGDGFALPLATGSVDAVTIAFGMRNLRPQAQAVAELQRVLRPGGTLVVLEASGPQGGAFAPFHRFWLRHMVPLLGRLSPDPSAYQYLGQSILEFGVGESFTSAATAAGFTRASERTFLMGATRLWVWTAPVPETVQTARFGTPARGVPPAAALSALEDRIWSGVQLALSAALAIALVYAALLLLDPALGLPLDAARRRFLVGLSLAAAAFFAFRAVRSFFRVLRPAPRA